MSGVTPCNEPKRRSAPTMSAACCAPRRSRRRAREHAKGEIKDAQLKEIEDREIEKIIRKQEEIGLKLATDGEFRRSWWQFDFYKGLDGVELYSTGQGIKFAGVETKAESVRVAGKVDFSTHPHIEHFRFVKDHAKVTPKMTIPAPSTLHFRQGRQSISKERLSRSRRLFPRRWPSLPARPSAPSTTPAAAICSSTTPPGR